MYPGLYTPRARQYILENFTPVGLHVLVVDDDPLCLMVLDRMLRQCNYKVTTSNTVNNALKLLREEDEDYDIVISDVYMPDEDGFKLLEVIGLELDLPVIMISANGDFSVVMKGIIHGACDYLIKPVRIEELKNIWQHVIRRKSKDFFKSELQEENDVDARASEAQEELYKKRKEVLEIPAICADDISSSPKKARVNWSVQLHQQFVTAVNHLGIDKAVPKKIIEIMNVQGLSRENVASHLQKYRLYLKRLSGVIPGPLPVASFQASDNGAPGGSMVIRAGRRSSDPVASVKGLNLGAGLDSKTGKIQKVDSGTMKSLSQLKSFQQKQAANRAQVLCAIGVEESSSTASSSRGGLFRMASLDVSFLLQAAAQAKEEALSPGTPSVKVVDDLATCSISRSVKLEDDVVFPGASPRQSIYDARRQITREGLVVHSSSITSGEEQRSRIHSDIVNNKSKVNHCGISSVDLEKLSCGSAAPVYVQGISEEAMKCQGNPMRSSVNQVSSADYGFAYRMPSTPYMQALQADLTESSSSELNKPDYGRDKLQPIEKATSEVAASVDLATDDTDNSTRQSYEVSTGSMVAKMSGETFSGCSFEALIDELDLIPHNQQHIVQQTNSELLDVDEYLQLD